MPKREEARVSGRTTTPTQEEVQDIKRERARRGPQAYTGTSVTEGVKAGA